MLFSTNTGLRSWHTRVFRGGFIFKKKTIIFRELKSYSNTMSVYTGKVNVTIQYGCAAFCNWSQTSSKTTRTIAYNRSATGELFVGGCLILVCSVTKEIKWVSAEKTTQTLLQKDQIQPVCSTTIFKSANFGIHQEKRKKKITVFLKFLILYFGKHLGRIWVLADE